MPSKEKFCPPWIIKIITSLMVYDYITKDETFFIQTKKFIDYLSKYAEITAAELEGIATLKLQFLGEVKNIKDPYLLLNHYMYSIINEIEPGEKGIIKGNPYEGQKKKTYKIHNLIKDFKVFVYSCRSALTLKAPTGWDIRNEEDIGELTEVINKQFSLDDLIESVSKNG